MRRFWLVSLLLGAPAWAVPPHVTHQGRVLDAVGLPLEGDHALTVKLYGSAAATGALWQETRTVDFDNGYFSVLLGADPSNRFPSTVTGASDLYIGVAVDAAAEIGGRHPVASVPFALRADSAVDVDGGEVDATSISIGGTPLVHSDGSLTIGSMTIEADGTLTVNGTVIVDADGGLGGGGPGDLVCAAGQSPEHNGAAWVCEANHLTSAEVRAAVTAQPVDLAFGSRVDGAFISTGDHLRVSDLASQAVTLGVGSKVGTQSISVGDHYSDAQVEAYLAGEAVDLHPSTTIGSATIATGAHYTDAAARAFIEGNAVDLHGATTIDGAAVSRGPHYTDAAVKAYVESTPLTLAQGTTISGITLPDGLPKPATGNEPNRLGNGGFDLWQRGTSAQPDLWYPSGTVTFSRVSDASRTAAARLVATADTAFVFQKLENPTDWRGLSLTLSIDARQVSGQSGKVQIDDGIGVTEAPITGATFRRITLSHAVNTAATKVAVRVFPGNGTAEIDSATLVVGVFSTVPFVPPDPVDDLRRALRYYETGRFGFYNDDSVENPSDAAWWTFRETKAAVPTVTVSVGDASSTVPSNFVTPAATTITTTSFGYDHENENPERGTGTSDYTVRVDYVATVPVTY